MKYFLTVHKARGVFNNHVLKFTDEDFENYHLIEKGIEEITEFKIDPGQNVLDYFSVAALPGAVFFAPYNHPEIVFAVHHEDGTLPDPTQKTEVSVSILQMIISSPDGRLLCPGCGQNDYFRTAIFGKGNVDNIGILQSVDEDYCSVDYDYKKYYCPECGMAGSHNKFEHANFLVVEVQDITAQ